LLKVRFLVSSFFYSTGTGIEGGVLGADVWGAVVWGAVVWGAVVGLEAPKKLVKSGF
jgi:hypothetical protein